MSNWMPRTMKYTQNTRIPQDTQKTREPQESLETLESYRTQDSGPKTGPPNTDPRIRDAKTDPQNGTPNTGPPKRDPQNGTLDPRPRTPHPDPPRNRTLINSSFGTHWNPPKTGPPKRDPQNGTPKRAPKRTPQFGTHWNPRFWTPQFGTHWVGPQNGTLGGGGILQTHRSRPQNPTEYTGSLGFHRILTGI
jgi:hypothetical protein